ncbi:MULTISPECIES: TetR/AcrR family transcriptional regulator [Pseudomonas]|uniref:TetR family transcriptional regulator n=1 Tax=Pseudomonas izuensis TaxID=2684212 RepID=A0ABM7RQP0_9PSED|nr:MULTISPECIES: TetR/AcrR family transcriptional regulator [Pseudomonas]RKS17114.1 TetR family transcriptional regulator [Pseudomonas sp. WPR_5_2]BCX68004.1 TetR family transcriptional regulator [Pseudomonas izuensis]
MPKKTSEVLEQAVAEPIRRNPTQQRSRERQERILAVATELIATKGSDQLKMSEIAERSEISIGSLYQYFPDKSAVIRTLAERYNAESRRCIEEALGAVEDVPGLQAAYSDLLDQYYEIVLATPAMRDIWSGMQADKHLLALELEESRNAGGLLAETMLRVYPHSDAVQVRESAFLIWHLGEATMRLAISCAPGEGRGLVEAFKRMSLREILQPGCVNATIE